MGFMRKCGLITLWLITTMKLYAGINNPSGGGAGGLTAQTVTNLTSASATITGQGTHTLNIEVAASASGAAAVTNGANFFTSASYNTFNGGTLFNSITTNAFSSYLLGTYNQFGTTNVFSGYVWIATNASPSGASLEVQDVTGNHAPIVVVNDNNTAGKSSSIYLGDPTSGHYGLIRHTVNSAQVTYSGSSSVDVILSAIDSAHHAKISVAGTDMIDAANSTLTLGYGNTDTITVNGSTINYGVDASSAHTINGQTITFAHLASFNSDVLRIGPAGSVLTNGTSFVTLGTYNGVTPGNMLTNLASSADSAITWSAQGTRIMTPSLAGFVATNGSTANAGNYTNYSGANLRSTTTYTTGLVYTVAASDWCVGSIDTGQTVRIMLPTSGHTGRTLRIFKTNESGFSTIIDAGAGNNINGFTNLILNIKYAPVDLIYTGTEWIAK